MAIDTAAKRASALGVGLVFVLSIIPDGTIAQADRQTISNAYGGILAVEPSDIDLVGLSLLGIIDNSGVNVTGLIDNTGINISSKIDDSGINLLAEIETDGINVTGIIDDSGINVEGVINGD